MKYKKFIVFGWDDHYPSGGLGDLKSSFDTIPEVKEFLRKNYFENSEVIDRDTWEEITTF